ncbi:MAG: BBP7 family outer membrane beta-barrel protein [Planctomycetia bacterium]|nr:BBP7 family outer membrane beta-barrel protein [Planctomycetia bacterium]
MRPGLCAWLLLIGTAALRAQPAPPTSPPPIAPPAVLAAPELVPVVETPPLPFGATHEALAYPYLGWLKMEALLWWVKDGPLPEPLLTTGPVGEPDVAVLGTPGTRIVIGAEDQDYGTFFGGRWTWGTWFDPSRKCGLEVRGFTLERRAVLLNAESDATGSPILARPFIDATTGQERRAFVTFPNDFVGGLGVTLSDHLWGIETNLLVNVLAGGVPRQARQCPWGEWRLGLLAGVRYLDLCEDLTIQQVTRLIGARVANFGGTVVTRPSILFLSDGFAARNQFYGGQVGGQLEWAHGALAVELLGKLAIGGCHETLKITGATGLDRFPGFTSLQTLEGALLASPTNIGRQGTERFCFVPELGATVGWQCSSHVRLSAGYSFMYWSRVVRPGDQMDRTVDLSRLPINPNPNAPLGPERPARRFVESDYWAQGLHFGFEVRY